jgi:hypothetical protein
MSEPKEGEQPTQTLPEQPETEAETGGHPIHGRDEAIYEPNFGLDPATGEVKEMPDRQDPPKPEDVEPKA